MDNFSEQVEKSIKIIVPRIKNLKKYDNIVFLGMGGSAAAGDLFSDYYGDKPVHVIKSYDIAAMPRRKAVKIFRTTPKLSKSSSGVRTEKSRVFSVKPLDFKSFL